MNNIFFERLKELRSEKGIGQIELAKAIHVSKGIISLWENGLREPKLSNLIILAQYFEVSIDYLAGLES
ncbi:MAG: helix-turn-helix transcriptional regulator [Clostridia bacterium]|nr:helix-turn-helix transcriptional regulator [Clostridia bacterium]